MLILDKPKLIFIHVPKTGGTSIEAALEEVGFRRWGGQHIPAQYAKELVPDWADYKVFAFVRNPWDRMVSTYAFITGYKITFEEFLSGPSHYGARFFHVFEPQVNWTHNRDTKEQEVHTIGRFENLAKDFANICPSAPSLPHLNPSDHGDYRLYYTDETRNKVAQIFAEDIAEFGYSF